MSKKRKPGREYHFGKPRYGYSSLKALKGLPNHSMFIESKDSIIKQAEAIMASKYGVDMGVDFSALPLAKNFHAFQKAKNMMVGGSTYPRKRGGEEFY
jgi:hypothetical protein